MKQGLLIALFAFFITSAKANSGAVLSETLYQNFRQSIESNNKQASSVGLASFEQSLYVDALWTLMEENSTPARKALSAPNYFYYDLTQKLRLGILKIKYKVTTKLGRGLVSELENALLNPETDSKLIYLVGAYTKELNAAGHSVLIELAMRHDEFNNLASNNLVEQDNVVKDLFNHVTQNHGVKIYMFCRENRNYPCMMVMRDLQGEIVRNADGSLWTHKSLASSAHGLPSHVTNGNTPAGVWKINSVMPYADAPNSFGMFRRLILEFVPKSMDETLIKDLLPLSSHDKKWWKPTVVARDIGRDLFRIHGTLKINLDPASTFYPFMRTSGCIAQRENTYDGITYQDQRDLLDQIMVSLNLAPVYENETQAQGVLYLVELDREESAVTEKDLFARGIQ